MHRIWMRKPHSLVWLYYRRSEQRVSSQIHKTVISKRERRAHDRHRIWCGRRCRRDTRSTRVGWSWRRSDAARPTIPSLAHLRTERRHCTTNCTGTVDDILEYGYQIGCFPGLPLNATSLISGQGPQTTSQKIMIIFLVLFVTQEMTGHMYVQLVEARLFQ
jgi:hypothetical protein